MRTVIWGNQIIWFSLRFWFELQSDAKDSARLPEELVDDNAGIVFSDRTSDVCVMDFCDIFRDLPGCMSMPRASSQLISGGQSDDSDDDIGGSDLLLFFFSAKQYFISQHSLVLDRKVLNLLLGNRVWVQSCWVWSLNNSFFTKLSL